MSARASLLDSKAGIGLACAAAMAIGVGAVVWMHGADTRQPPPAPPTAAASAWDGPIGPGALAAAPLAGATLAQAGEKPLTDASGQLLTGADLHALFDSYLFGPNAAGERPARAASLRAYLKSRLSQPALGQAEQLVDGYLHYLEAAAALRARERFAQPDPAGLSDAQVEQALAWQQQRAQLRERMLGTTVAQAWFGADDSACQAAFEDWRKMRAPADSEDVDSNELRARRLHGAVLEQGRNKRAQSCASQLVAGGG